MQIVANIFRNIPSARRLPQFCQAAVHGCGRTFNARFDLLCEIRQHVHVDVLLDINLCLHIVVCFFAKIIPAQRTRHKAKASKVRETRASHQVWRFEKLHGAIDRLVIRRFTFNHLWKLAHSFSLLPRFVH